MHPRAPRGLTAPTTAVRDARWLLAAPAHTLRLVLLGAVVTLGATACAGATKRDLGAPVPSSPAAPSSSAASSAPPTTASAAPTPKPAVVFPLTGLPATSAAAARTSLAIKIDNVVGAWPQAGLNQADIVVDTPVEGGLTRLFAVFQSQDAPLVGPVRSARPVDGDLLRLLGGGYFAYSGANAGEIGPVKANSNAVMISFDENNGLFLKRSDHAAPHNVFNTTPRLYSYFSQVKPGLPAPHPYFSYSAAAPAGGTPTNGVTVHFPSATASWQWDGREYLRTQDGHPDVLMDGSQVSASDVVVMSVGLRDSGVRDSLRNVEPWPVVTGSGPCWVLRNGVRVQGTWSRPSLTSPMTLTDAAGRPITLQPGRAWVELAPTSSQPRFS